MILNESTGSTGVEYDGSYDLILEETSWNEVAKVAKLRTANNFWTIGDTKTITLNGTVGQITLDNFQAQVFILGFDHNSEVEGTGISFGCFKQPGTDEKLALTDTLHNQSAMGGTLWFNMNHWGKTSSPYSTNYGGWKGCDLRYDILGSTNVAPSGYGTTAVVGRTGYDPVNYDIVNAPKANTLLAALPQDLRSVMKPMTKWTDNVGGATGSVESNVTSSVEYLPLLANYEYETGQPYFPPNTYEATKQQLYAYFAAGNDDAFRNHRLPEYYATYWIRSPQRNSASSFCFRMTGGDPMSYSHYSRGIVTVLLVG